MIWNALLASLVIGLGMLVVIGIIYFAGWIALALICFFEDNLIPFINKTLNKCE